MAAHTFDTETACKYGILEAILLNNLYFWIQKNRANEKNFFDGRYWTYNSVKAFTEIFPYATAKQIRTALKKLIDNGLIITGNYNKSPYDRTLWYALTDKGFAEAEHKEFTENKGEDGSSTILPKGEMDCKSEGNVNACEGQPIPDINTNINTDISCQTASDVSDLEKCNNQQTLEQLNHDFEILYALYPKKIGRTKAFAHYKGWVGKGRNINGKIYRLTNRQIYFAIKNYMAQQETAGQADMQYWKNFDTLMGGQLLDYVVEC